MSLVLEAFPQDNIWRVRTYNAADGDNKVPGAAIHPNRWTSLVLVYDPARGPVEQLTLFVDGVPFVGSGVSTQHARRRGGRGRPAVGSPLRGTCTFG